LLYLLDDKLENIGVIKSIYDNLNIIYIPISKPEQINNLTKLTISRIANFESFNNVLI